MKLLLWFWLLTKRLYKNPTFLMILALIPLTVLGYSLTAKEDSGMVTVALAGERGPLTEEVYTALEESGQLLRYIRCDSVPYAELLVATGKADAAWIFSGDLQERVETFMASPTVENAFVRVVQREETVALALAREKLSGVILPCLCRSYYLQFLRQNYPEMENLSDEKLLEYYDGTDMGGTLFEYDSTGSNVGRVHYLLSPIRGLLAAVILLGGMAAAMYWIKDSQNGTFCLVPANRQILPELGSQLVTGLNLCGVSLVALLVSGQIRNLGAECLSALLYSVIVALFCMILRRLLGSIRVLGAVLPILMVAVLLVCPVFFDSAVPGLYRLLLPPTYYINSVFDTRYLWYMLPYLMLLGGLCVMLDWLHLQRTACKKPKTVTVNRPSV